MRPFKIHPSWSVRLIIAFAVVAALLAFGGWYHASQAARNRAIAIVARKFEEMYGGQAPSSYKPLPPGRFPSSRPSVTATGTDTSSHWVINTS